MSSRQDGKWLELVCVKCKEHIESRVNKVCYKLGPCVYGIYPAVPMGFVAMSEGSNRIYVDNKQGKIELLYCVYCGVELSRHMLTKKGIPTELDPIQAKIESV